jgi:chromate reductase, NAD(P)H dehydrogenase (quinone)
MESNKVLTLVGGISRDSLNKKFYESIKDLNLKKFEFIDYDISKLPFFSQDIEMDPPDSVTRFKEKIRDCDALLLITPEYNRSFPGVLKNAIDWGSRPYGQNLWDSKPAALLGASPGNIGTFGAQHHLRQVLAYLNMHAMGQPEFYFNASNSFNEEGELTNNKTKELLHKFFEAFHNHINLFIRQEERAAQTYKSQGLEDSQFAH